MVGKYWKRVVQRAWRRSLELVRLESWERIIVFLITIAVPAVAAWYFVGDMASAAVRALATAGGAAIGLAVMFGWGMIRLPAVMDAEAEEERKKLASQVAKEERANKRRETLGNYLSRGTQLMSECRNYDQFPPEEVANQWLNELIGYLETEFSPVYVARVNDGGSVPVGYSSQAHKDHDALYNGIRIRVFHLQEFLKELGPPA